MNLPQVYMCSPSWTLLPPCKISCMKRVASPGSMHDTGCLGLVHWDDPEGWNSLCLYWAPPLHRVLFSQLLQHFFLTLQLFSLRLFGVPLSLPSSKCWCLSRFRPRTSHLFWLATLPLSVYINSQSLKQSPYANNTQTNTSSVTHTIFQLKQVTLCFSFSFIRWR